ncbi:MAG TPA: hypothetical protein VMC41_02445 [Candidatus Nanoarchaeia archaeon]|nr:hypothetical protein [Candidatus Nanoarchaeia archaeon]
MKLVWKKQIFYFAIAALCLVAITGAAIYYFYALNWPGILLTLILSALGVWFFSRQIFVEKKETSDINDITPKFIIKKIKIDWKKITLNFFWLIPYFFFFIFSFLFLLKARTSASLTSPWQVVSARFFIVYILATAYLFWLILKQSRFMGWLIVAHYFLSFSVLWIIFKIGYGYDPFIHQATVKLIDQQGFVLPKTPYYLGQYSLVLIAHKLFFIPIVWADKLLVPLLAAITLPPTIYLFLKKYFSKFSFVICNLSFLILLILPFSIFTLTVPQNLAYLFLLLAILFSLFAGGRAEIILSFLLALAALAVHPAAGVPALLFVSAIAVCRYAGKSVARKIIYASLFLLAAGVLPLLFYLSSNNSAAAGTDTAGAGLAIPIIVFPRQENIILDFIYFFLGNEWLILLILSVLAAYAIYRWRKKNPDFTILGITAFGLLAAYFITGRLNFNFLISYERNDYALRILFDVFIFLIPVLAILACKFINLILNAKPFIKYSWLAFLVILIAVSLYGSYPRLDNYYNSRDFTTGADDLAAVNWIAQDSGKNPYVVLADQQVSVGALWTFGFSHYFNEFPSREGCRSFAAAGCVNTGKSNVPIYFYPIPTGGPLYQIYLQMVYQKPDRATALQAADLTGAKTVYFVINKYWTDFDKIVEQAKIEASSFKNINNGTIYIFKYLK